MDLFFCVFAEQRALILRSRQMLFVSLGASLEFLWSVKTCISADINAPALQADPTSISWNCCIFLTCLLKVIAKCCLQVRRESFSAFYVDISEDLFFRSGFSRPRLRFRPPPNPALLNSSQTALFFLNVVNSSSYLGVPALCSHLPSFLSVLVHCDGLVLRDSFFPD